MLAQSLCELAEHVGVSQTAIARHLGIDRVNINYWARGHREVPDHHLGALLAFIFARARQQAALAKTWTPQARRRFFRKLLPLVVECRAENLAARGLADTDSVAGLVAHLDRFKTMSAEQLDRPETTQQLLTLSQRLVHLLTVHSQHAPLMELVEELRHADTDAFESETAEPALPSTV
jgi:hypothetical protein